ncbi:MAG: amidohydrolase family protein [Candidatus Altiarchaeota archaeon]|nr:amidohydrolase family protein [Candidatus Altiarchaeota archaeon]
MVEGRQLIIKNAQLPNQSATTDILIKDGKISELGEISGKGIDACGMLVTPGFVNIHTHLDKADLLSKMSPYDFGKTLEENRELLKKFKRNYTVDEIVNRAATVIWEFAENGVTAIRTQVDVDSTGGLAPLNAIMKLKKDSPVKLQICAFPQEGVLNESARERVEEALDVGADLLGGLPLVEKDVENQLQHIDVLFEIARKYDVDLDVQVDESNNPEDYMLPYLAEKTIENKWYGRVTATHCISLSKVDDNVAKETIRLVKEANMNVNVTPSANMITRFQNPDDVHARGYNSITLVRELASAGVNVCIGTDNIRDIFYPMGNTSMLREMHVAAAATRMTSEEDPEALFKMASVNGAKNMGLKYGLEIGCRGDLIVLDAKNFRDALNSKETIPYVIREGKIICESNLVVKHGR